MEIKGVQIDHLLVLIGLLFIVYFFLNMKETFEQFKTKEESDKALSDAYHKYIWGTPYPAR